jgi:hypothetical protein
MSTRAPVNKLKAAMHGMQSTAAPMPAATTAPVALASVRKAELPPSRQGKRVVSAYLDKTAARQLKLLAAERESSVQSLLEEALNDLFRKHAKSAVA